MREVVLPSMKVEEAVALNWVWLGQVEAQRVPEGREESVLVDE